MPYLYRFPPQNKEGLGPLSQEPRELVNKDILDLVRLLDPDADADAVHAGLNKDLLVLVARNGKRVEQELRRRLGFYLRDIVPLGGL
jgi:hypothetical protein